MINDDTDLIPYLCDLLRTLVIYDEDNMELVCSTLLILEKRIREANYNEVLEDGVTLEEFEEFFTAKLEQQG